MSLTIDALVEHNVHIGSLRKESNPKTRRFWLDIVGNTVVINPEAIIEQLNNAKKKIEDAKASKKQVLIICESPLYSEEIEKVAQDNGFHYLNYKIPSGFLTNFDTLIARIKSMNEMAQFLESDEYHGLMKREQGSMKRKFDKIKAVYNGVKNLRTSPDLVVVVDGKSMVKFVDEIIKTKKDCLVIGSTNFDRWLPEENMLIGNVYSHDALDFMIKYVFKS